MLSRKDVTPESFCGYKLRLIYVYLYLLRIVNVFGIDNRIRRVVIYATVLLSLCYLSRV